MCNIKTNVLWCYYSMHLFETFATSFISLLPRAAVSSVCSVIPCRKKVFIRLVGACNTVMLLNDSFGALRNHSCASQVKGLICKVLWAVQILLFCSSFQSQGWLYCALGDHREIPVFFIRRDSCSIFCFHTAFLHFHPAELNFPSCRSCL